MNNEIKCCSEFKNQLDKNFWNNQWQQKHTGWDIGYPSTPIKNYIDTISCKNSKILIPGCGNAYEAEYLLSIGFKDITIIDISSELFKNLVQKYDKYIGNELTMIIGDFFKHQGQYDLIIEQTFFCAIEPTLREKYRDKMDELLAQNGKLVGLLFNRDFDQNPPFGGNENEYRKLFENKFRIEKMEICNSSIPQRKNTELWIELVKK